MRPTTKTLATLFAVAAITAAVGAVPAQAAFGLKSFEVSFTNEDGSPATQAGSHPFAMSTVFLLNTKIDPKFGEIADEELKSLRVQLPPGFAGNPTAMPRCEAADFLNVDEEGYPACPNNTAVGATKSLILHPGGGGGGGPVYNLVPPPGVAAKIGFFGAGVVPVTVELGVNGEAPNNIVAGLINIPQAAQFYGSRLEVWGNPAAAAHDPYRGRCLSVNSGTFDEFVSKGSCPATGVAEKPFITLPRICAGPLLTSYEVTSWQSPSAPPVKGSALSPALVGCEKSPPFSADVKAQPTATSAESPSGLNFDIDVDDKGLSEPDGIAQSDIRRVVTTLPVGMTVNPSAATGLAACDRASYEAESIGSQPGQGCPQASKVGEVEVQTPLLEGETLKGSVFVASQDDNPFGTLLALYLVIRSPALGIVVKRPLKVETDPLTGRVTTVADDLPQLPFSHLELRFREGPRSPLVSPPGCGAYEASTVLTPWSGEAPIKTTSTFQITTGPNNGPCPSGAASPFNPTMEAGTFNNAAGKYSPFYLRLSRNDGEQELTHFSIKLPRGIVAKLAGVPFCPDAAIAAAKARTGSRGGQEELDHPSCPAASEIGHTLAGAGVGSSLAYAPGKVYLAGPYKGGSLSIAAITAAKVGPFDLGTVVIRSALKVNPETAEVFIDASGSDAIPHIIKGIPVRAREIRAYVDKPEFVLNPTSCEPTSTASTLSGSGLDFGSEADDRSIALTAPFQAADCASLGFAPKLALSVKGASKRTGHPRFKAVLTPRQGDANTAFAQVTLPHSVFLDQAHIKTICTRVQFNSGPFPGANCPAASIYGYAKAITSILDEPIQGPVFLRSSSNPLPDLVAALHSGRIDFNLVGRIDSVKGGRIRNTFETAPDAPVTKFTLEMQGGKKGLLINSTDLCKSTNRAIADFTGQNGKRHVFNPTLVPDCGKGRKRGKATKKHERPSARRVVSSSW